MNKHQFNNSSSISHIDYDDTNETMIICFTSGGTYHYPQCSKKHYEALKTADSPGKHFHAHIKPHFKGVKLQ